MRRAIGVVVVVAAVAGCGLLERSSRRTTPPATVPAADEDVLEWARAEPTFVVVRKSCRSLDVYRHGERVASYPAVFGLGGSDAKTYEGDRRTPNGLYMVIGKRRHPRWRHFMLLDYPNTHDWERYAQAVDAGEVPMRGDEPAGIGGAIGIHGTDKPQLNARGVDWTWGCVSLANEHIEALNRLAPVGTLVLIQE